jgi:hypothetical protein
MSIASTIYAAIEHREAGLTAGSKILSGRSGEAYAMFIIGAIARRVEDGDHLTRAKAVKKATKRTVSANTFSVVAADGLPIAHKCRSPLSGAQSMVILADC